MAIPIPYLEDSDHSLSSQYEEMASNNNNNASVRTDNSDGAESVASHYGQLDPTTQARLSEFMASEEGKVMQDLVASYTRQEARRARQEAPRERVIFGLLKF